MHSKNEKMSYSKIKASFSKKNHVSKTSTSGRSRIFQMGRGGCVHLLFGDIFAANSMKMKEIGPRGGVPVPSPPLDSPMITVLSLTHSIDTIVKLDSLQFR